MAEAEIKGLAEVMKKLEGLGPDLRKKALRHGVGRAASIVRKAATQAAPKDTGDMRKNIRVQFASKTSKRIGGIAFRIGVRGGAQSPGAEVKFATTRKGKKSATATGSATWYWRLVEFGTQKMPARPFMRPALANNVSRVIDSIAQNVDKGITKFTKTGTSE